MNEMIYKDYTSEIEKELMHEIESEKKFLTFRKLLKIFELNSLLNG